jgi:hypothetical protein
LIWFIYTVIKIEPCWLNKNLLFIKITGLYFLFFCVPAIKLQKLPNEKPPGTLFITAADCFPKEINGCGIMIDGLFNGCLAGTIP